MEATEGREAEWRLFERADGGRSWFWAVRRVSDVIDLWYGQRRPKGTVLARLGDDDVLDALVEKKRRDGYVERAPIAAREGPPEEAIAAARARAREDAASARRLGHDPVDQLREAAERSDVDRVRRIFEDGLPRNDSTVRLVLERVTGPHTLAIVQLVLADREDLRGLLHGVARRQPVRHGQATLVSFTAPAPDRDAKTIVRYLVERGADLEERDADGRTPLHVALTNPIMGAHALAALLEAGADPNARLPGGETALHVAAGEGGLERVRRLLGHGADASIHDDRGRTPLDVARDAPLASVDVERALIAAMHATGQPDEAASVLESLAGLLERSRREAGGDLHLCAHVGDVDGTLGHLDEGADPDAVDDQWLATPLGIARERGHADVEAVLLAAGAREDVRPVDVTANELAERRWRGIVERVLPVDITFSDRTPTHVTPAERATIDAWVAAAIRRGALGDAPEECFVAGQPLFAVCVEMGLPETVRALLSRGRVDVRASDVNAAARHASSATLDALLAVAPARDRRPLERACGRGRIECVRRLLEHGVDPRPWRGRGHPSAMERLRVQPARAPWSGRIDALLRHAWIRRFGRDGSPGFDVLGPVATHPVRAPDGTLAHPMIAVRAPAAAVATERGAHALISHRDVAKTAVPWAPHYEAIFARRGDDWTFVIREPAGDLAQADATAASLGHALGCDAAVLWTRERCASFDRRGVRRVQDVVALALALDLYFPEAWPLPRRELRAGVVLHGMRKRDVASLDVVVFEDDPWPARFTEEDRRTLDRLPRRPAKKRKQS